MRVTIGDEVNNKSDGTICQEFSAVAHTKIMYTESAARVAMSSWEENDEVNIATDSSSIDCVFGMNDKCTVNEAKPTAAQKPSGSRRRHRDKRREEIQWLRTQAQALERRVDCLRQMALAAVNGNGESAVHIKQETDALARSWREIAANQFEQRFQAETENAALRQAIKRLFEFAQSVQTALGSPEVSILVLYCLAKRRTLTSPILQNLPPFLLSRFDTAVGSDNAAVFEHLTAFLPQLYDQVHSIFSDPRLNTLEDKLQDVRLQHESQTFDVLLSGILPFDVPMTAQVMWEMLFCPPFKHQGIEVKTLGHTNDSVAKDVRGFVTHRGGYVDFRRRFVSRRYISEDRTVIVTAGISEPVMVEGATMEGIALRCVSWVVIENPRNPRFRVEGVPVAQVFAKHLVTPFVIDSNHSSTANVPVLMDYFLRNADVSIDAGGQVIENRLLEASLQATRSLTREPTASM